MIKKIVLILFVIVLILFGIKYYNSQKTTECWWGVIYPSLSFVAIEEDNYEYAQISSLDEDYMPHLNNKDIQFKFAIVEWLKEMF